MSVSNIENRDRLIRLTTIIGDKKANPPIEPLIDVCKASWYKGMKDGIYPQGIRMSPRVVMWRLSDVLTIVNGAPATLEK
jgi:predicted DNA-binding transcriptional regulator AlpA